MKKYFYAIISFALLTGCATTDISDNENKISNLKFDNKDSYAFRLARLSGITDITDSQIELNRASSSSLLSGATFGVVDALSSNSSIFSTGLSGLGGALFSPNMPSSKPRLIVLANGNSKKEAKDVFALETKRIFARSIKANESDVNVKWYSNKRESLIAFAKMNVGNCEEIQLSHKELLKNDKVYERGVKLYEGGCGLMLKVKVHEKVNTEQLPFIGKSLNPTIVTGTWVASPVLAPVVAAGIKEDNSFFYLPPNRYNNGSYGVSLVNKYPFIQSNTSKMLFVRPGK